MVRSYGVALLVLTLLTGCAAKTPTPSEISSGNPLFNIAVEPVTEPQLYRYGPAIGQVEFKFVVTTSKGTNTNMSMLVKYSVIEKGDSLLWHIYVPEWTEGGKLYQPRVSLLDISMDMNHRGIVDATQITFPVIREYNISDPKALKTFEDIADSMSGLAIHLPEGPIVSGDPIHPANIDEFKKVLSDIDNTPYHKLDGEFSYEGVRYVSTTLNDTFSGKDIKSGERVYITVNSRNILRKDNMEATYGYGTVEGKDMRGNVLFSTQLIIAKTEAGLSH